MAVPRRTSPTLPFFPISLVQKCGCLTAFVVLLMFRSDNCSFHFSADALSQRTTNTNTARRRRMKLPFPTINRPKGNIWLRYTSDTTTNDNSFSMERRRRASFETAPSTTTTTTTVGTSTTSCDTQSQQRLIAIPADATTAAATTTTRLDIAAAAVALADFPSTPTINASTIVATNVAESTMMISSTTTSSSSSGKMRALWKRIQAASKVDKEAIAKLGLSFGLTYNLISNINGSISLSLAWYMASAKTGLSPLAPGQWKALLAAYGTLYVVLCFVRPFRIALALGATRKMDSFLEKLQTKFGCKRPAAIGVAAVCSLVLWISLSIVGVTLASMLAGVPFWRIATPSV